MVVRMPAHHDALFKLAFTQPHEVAALVRTIVPPSLAAAIDWTSLRLASGSFVDESLRGRFSDLLFEARVGLRRALLYLLCEHQSRNEPRMPLRYFRYMDRIWTREDADGQDAYLPPIIPILISNAQAGWTAPTRFHELFDPAFFEDSPELARFVPSFELLVDDLRRTSDDSLISRGLAGFGKLALWLLRDGRADRIFSALDHWAALLDDLPRDRLEAVIRYIAAVGGGSRVILDEFCANLERIAPHTRETVMTYLEQRDAQQRQEGRREGRQEGRQEGRKDALRQQIALKFGPLSDDAERRVATADGSEVDRWLERVLFASTLEQLFADEH
jgi:hypothetical protein